MACPGLPPPVHRPVLFAFMAPFVFVRFLWDYAYFVFSLNMSRRAGDILHLHVYDVLNPGGSFKTHVTFEHEQKNRQEVYCIVEQ